MIDWSKAPEGATHWSPIIPNGLPWRKMIAWGWETWDGNSWIATVNPRPDRYIDRNDAAPTTPTLETMLTEWRDLEARAQAAQAEADALFEHAGQCHGEIVVRLAELGWGAPRGEPVVTLDTPLDMTDWRNWQVGDIVKRVSTVHASMMSRGEEGFITQIADHPTNPVHVGPFYVPNVTDLVWISRPSTPQ